ncbi:MAG TPA: polysaccharide biosynthesis/export family protein, partial [Candidatus Acidoferrum sp.]
MNLRPFVLLAALLCSPLVQAQDSSKPSVPAAAPSKTDAASKSNTAPGLPSDSEYKIGPQDVVRIDVWKEPDISRTIPVRP